MLTTYHPSYLPPTSPPTRNSKPNLLKPKIHDGPSAVRCGASERNSEKQTDGYRHKYCYTDLYSCPSQSYHSTLHSAGCVAPSYHTVSVSCLAVSCRTVPCCSYSVNIRIRIRITRQAG